MEALDPDDELVEGIHPIRRLYVRLILAGIGQYAKWHEEQLELGEIEDELSDIVD